MSGLTLKCLQPYQLLASFLQNLASIEGGHNSSSCLSYKSNDRGNEMLLFFGPHQTLVNRAHLTEQLEINTSYVFVVHRGHPLLFQTVTSLHLLHTLNRTLPWTWGLIAQHCLLNSASARCACLCGSGSWNPPRCGIGSQFPPRCETGFLCLLQCETGSSVLPKRLHWSQKLCGTSSAWSYQQRALEEKTFINFLLCRLGRNPFLTSSPNHPWRSLQG